LERIGVRGAGDAALGEDGGDVARGSDVEGGMRGVNVGSDADTLKVSYFRCGTVFDGDGVACENREIESRNGRCDVKGNVVFFGQDRDLVGADFIGSVAVGGDAIRAGNDGADISGFSGNGPPCCR